MASANVSFIDDADDNEVIRYMQKCQALVFPGEEDFGIVPLEAQACGKPVIALGKGGASETIIGLDQSLPAEASAKAGQNAENNTTGIFFYEQNPKALWEAILLFEKLKSRFVPQKCRDNALRFDRSIYKRSIHNYIQSVITETAPLTN
jgi:glycosyltransferase involved in cell wall biosynthesis